MSIEAKVAELTEKHHQLEAEIEEEAAHPAADSLKITELKRQKLQIKEEIARLEGSEERVA